MIMWPGKSSYELRPLLITAILSILIGSCDLLDPDEPTPAYIHLNTPSLSTDYAKEGSNSQKISDYWVYVNDNLLGVFEFPIEFPVLAEGDARVEVFAGIKNNGISAQRRAYPFYRPYVNDSSAFLVADESLVLDPKFSYESNTEFSWLEDFERVNLSIENGSSSGAQLVTLNSDLAFQGQNCGQVILDKTNPSCFFTQSEYVVLPKFGTEVYLEINYRNDASLVVGVRSLYSDGSARDLDAVVINPSSSWNKIYVDLTDIISDEVNAVSSLIYFYASYSDSKDSEEILIDNIKLLHF